MKIFQKLSLATQLGTILLTLPSIGAAFSGSGSGTQLDPYQITNLTQLQEMQDELTAHYRLMNNIDASATSSWTSVSDSNANGFLPVGDVSTPFEGSLKGGGYQISNLFMNDTVNTPVGLFGYGKAAYVDSVELVDVSIRGGAATGALIGQADSNTQVQDITVSGDVYGLGDSFTNVGGVIGRNEGTATRLSSSVDVTGTASTFLTIGGVVGRNSGLIQGSDASGKVMGLASLYHYTGGIVGGNYGYTHTSQFSGTLSADQGSLVYLGGIAGDNGGVVGYCMSSGLIKRESTTYVRNAGGIVGNSYEGTVHNTISSMEINVYGQGVGGVVGKQRSGAVRNSAFVGTYTAPSTQTGIVGLPNNEGYYSYVDNSYWDTTAAGVTVDSNGFPRSSSEMMSQATFVDWDFTKIWSIDEGVSHPTLRLDELEDTSIRSLYYRVYSLKGIIEGPAIQWGEPGDSTQSVTAVATTDGYRFLQWDDGLRTATRSDVIGADDQILRAIFGTFTINLDTILLDGQESWRLTDTAVVAQEDTILTHTDTLIDSSNVVIQIADTTMSIGVVGSDTTIIFGSIDTTVTISYDTLTYVPVLRVDSLTLKDTTTLDTAQIIDTLIQFQADTIVNHQTFEYETHTLIVYIDSMYDDVSFSTHLDTTITLDSTWISGHSDTLSYVPHLTLDTSTVLDTLVLDTQMVVDSTYQVDSDTIVTTYWYVYSSHTLILMIDSLHDEVSFASYLDTTITLDTTLGNAEIDTLEYVDQSTGLQSVASLELAPGQWTLQVYSSAGALLRQTQYQSPGLSSLNPSALSQVPSLSQLPRGRYFVRGSRIDDHGHLVRRQAQWVKQD